MGTSDFMLREKKKRKIREEILMDETIWRMIQKERIRKEMNEDEIMSRRLLEAEVRRELSIQTELASRREGRLFIIGPRGLPAPLLSVEGEGRLRGERFVTSHDGRFWMSSELRREFGGLGTGVQKGVEAKSPLVIGEHKERIVLPAKPIQGINANVSSSSASAKTQLIREWSCALCQITATSEQGLNDHLQGKRHKAKETESSKKGTEFHIGWSTNKTPSVSRKDAPSMDGKLSKKSNQDIVKSAGSSSQDHANTKVKLEARQEEKANEGEETSSEIQETNGASIVLGQQLDDSLRNTGTPTVRTQEHKKNLFKFWCEICQIGTHTEKVMKRHRRGKNHLAHKKNMVGYWCDVCQIGANTKEVMEMHLTGKKHLALLQKRNRYITTKNGLLPPSNAVKDIILKTE